MKFIILTLALLCAVASIVTAKRSQNWPPKSTGPTFPRPQNPFGHRFRREAESEGPVAVLKDQTLVYEDDERNYKSEEIFQDTFNIPSKINEASRFKRAADNGPRGGVSATVIKPLGGPDRKPSFNLDYNRNIYQGRRGSIDAYGGLQKTPGQKLDRHIGVQGRWRFRRDVDDLENDQEFLENEMKTGEISIDDE